MSNEPAKLDDLTTEQQAALVEFAERFTEGLHQLADAFKAIGTAAIEANRQVQAVGAMRETAPFVLDGDIPWAVEDDDATPTPDGDPTP